MKKTYFYRIATLCAALLVCALLSVTAFANEVFLSASEGSDLNDGTTMRAPLATLSAAIEAVKDGGTVIVMDRYPVTGADRMIDGKVPSYAEPAHTGKITFTSAYMQYDFRTDGAGLYFAADQAYDVAGDLRFENINIISDATPVYLVGNFNALEFGEGFDTVNTQGTAKKLYVIGGYMAPVSTALPADKDVNITIDSGKFHRVICFGHIKGAGTYTFTGTANVTVNNARIDRFYGGATLNHYSGNLNLTVNGGAFSDIYLAGDGTRPLKGNATVHLNAGNIVSTLYINNVLGHTDITLDALTLKAMKVTYGSDALKTQSYGKRIALRYNSIVHSAEFVDGIEGLTSAERFGIVYYKAGENGDGLTPDTPTGDIYAAVNLLANGGGDIVIDGTLSPGFFKEPAHAAPITYKGGTVSLGSGFDLGGPVTFDGVTVTGGTVKGTDVTFTATAKASGVSANADRIDIAAGEFSSVSGKDVTLTGGKVATTILMGERLIVDGAAVETVQLASPAEISMLSGSIGTFRATGIDGITLRYSGGSIDNCTLSSCKNTELVPGAGADAATLEKLKPQFEKTAAENVAFVCDGGTGNGSSPDYAAGNIADAFAALPNGGTVVVIGKTTVANTLTARSDAEYRLTSVYGGVDYRETNGAQIYFTANLFLFCPTVVDGIHLVSAKSPCYLVFNGYKSTIGKDVVCTTAPNISANVCIVAGARHNTFTVDKTDLTINGGTWHHVYGASTAAMTYPNLDTRLTINGGEFYGEVCAMGAGNQSGKGLLTINGGTFYGGVYGLRALATETFEGAIDIVLNGGTFYGKMRVAPTATTAKGEYTVTVNGGDFTHLTDIVGGKEYEGLHSTVKAGSGFDFGAMQKGTFTYQNPIRKAADPRIALVDGMYYYMYTSASTLAMYKAANVADLAYSKGELIFDAREASDALGGRIHCIWPSKLEYFPAEAFGAEYEGWYLFFSTFGRELDGLPSSATDGQSRRSYVLKCTTNDLQGDWVNPVTGEKGKPEKFGSDTEDWVNNVDWCAGETALRYNGEYYTLWIEQRDRNTENFRQVMYLSKMKNPWTVTGKVLELVRSEYDWEKGGYGYAEAEKKWYPMVIEGITPINGDNGELHVLYAASGYWTTEYKLGQMTYRGGDLLEASSWKKSPTPIFYKNDEVNGVGGPSICTTPDGKSRYMMYHGYLGKNTSSGRFAFMEPYSVDANGVTIGKDNHPSPLDTTFTMPLNAMPLGFKLVDFDNIGTTRVTLTIGKNVGHVNHAASLLDASPVIKNSRTMLPVRFVAEAFGAKVGWDGATSTVTLAGADGRNVSIKIGASSLTLNGESVALDSPAYIDPASNRTYLPVRAVAEALGATVFWNGDLSMAMLTK